MDNGTNKPLMVANFRNEETQMESRVYDCAKSYNVTLVDLDSGNTLPQIRKYPAHMKAEAIAEAKRLVSV